MRQKMLIEKKHGSPTDSRVSFSKSGYVKALRCLVVLQRESFRIVMGFFPTKTQRSCALCDSPADLFTHYLTESIIALMFSTLAFIGTSQPDPSMNPPFIPMVISFSQYCLTSSSVP